MPEYIFTNLPQYIRVTPRTDFANSVVQANHVLLFSEDGETLTGKLPDGTFITIGGSGGTDVSDTTATAATVLSGYDFYNSSGVKTSGSIQNVTASASGNVVTVPAGYIASAQTLTIGTAVSAQTITPGTVDQTIAADSFLSGAITIKGDANLIAANIADGVTIFGVTGTHQGGSMDFYKCASVQPSSTVTYYTVSGAGVAYANGRYEDTGMELDGHPLYAFTNPENQVTYYLYYYMAGWVISTNYEYGLNDAFYMTQSDPPTDGWFTDDNQYLPIPTVTQGTETIPGTWTGYKAVLSGGVYSYESSATSGLTFGSGFTPDPDQVYPNEALIQVARMIGVIPPDYVYFHKLDSATGWDVSASGAGVVTDSTLGRDVFQITAGSGYFKTTAGILDVPYDCANRTMSFWMKEDASVSSGWAGIGYGGGNENGIRFVCGIYENYPSFTAWGYDYFQTSYGLIDDLNWHHYAVTLTNGNTITMFKDGVQIFSTTLSTLSTKHEYIVLGDVYEGAYAPIASFANLRIYDRILTAAEITALAAEFTVNQGS